MSLKDHLFPTLHNAVGTIIATVVIAVSGGLYFWLRGLGSISLPIWMVAVVAAVIIGGFAWLLFRLRAYARACGLVLHSASWGCESRAMDVTHIVRSKIRDAALTIRANNDALGGDPCPGVGKFLNVDYSWKGRRMSRSVAEPQLLSIP